MAKATVKWNDTRALNAAAIAINTGVQAAANVVADTTRINLRQTNYPTVSSPGNSPSRDRGTLARSVVATEAVAGVAFVGTNLKYGRVLEFGGVIRPRRAKLLPVPLVGRRRWERLVREGGGTVRGIKNTFLVRTKRNQLLLIQDTGAFGLSRRVKHRQEAIAVLKPFVTIQPRPWLRRSMLDAAPEAQRRAAQAARNSFIQSMKSGGS